MLKPHKKILILVKFLLLTLAQEWTTWVTKLMFCFSHTWFIKVFFTKINMCNYGARLRILNLSVFSNRKAFLPSKFGNNVWLACWARSPFETESGNLIDIFFECPEHGNLIFRNQHASKKFVSAKTNKNWHNIKDLNGESVYNHSVILHLVAATTLHQKTLGAYTSGVFVWKFEI